MIKIQKRDADNNGERENKDYAATLYQSISLESSPPLPQNLSRNKMNQYRLRGEENKAPMSNTSCHCRLSFAISMPPQFLLAFLKMLS